MAVVNGIIRRVADHPYTCVDKAVTGVFAYKRQPCLQQGQVQVV